MIKLIDSEPVASGGVSYVFQHPQDPDLLIKIQKQKAVDKACAKASFRCGRRRRYLHLLKYIRCVEEQTAVLASDGMAPEHLEKLVGLIETDRGVGLLVHRESYRGRLAPTLSLLIKEGRVDETLLAKANDFISWLMDSPIVVNDLRAVNIVLSDSRAANGCFVLIDGYGDTAFIPLRSWFPWVNRYVKWRKIQALKQQCRLARSRMPSASKPRGAVSVMAGFDRGHH